VSVSETVSRWDAELGCQSLTLAPARYRLTRSSNLVDVQPVLEPVAGFRRPASEDPPGSIPSGPGCVLPGQRGRIASQQPSPHFGGREGDEPARRGNRGQKRQDRTAATEGTATDQRAAGRRPKRPAQQPAGQAAEATRTQLGRGFRIRHTGAHVRPRGASGLGVVTGNHRETLRYHHHPTTSFKSADFVDEPVRKCSEVVLADEAVNFGLRHGVGEQEALTQGRSRATEVRSTAPLSRYRSASTLDAEGCGPW